jgi:hypothetical protein
MTKHVAVWIDHKEARIFDIEADRIEARRVAAPLHDLHERQAPPTTGAQPEAARLFLHEVARGLEGAKEVLIVGPPTAKRELLKFVHQRELAPERRVVGIATQDHPTDGQFLAYAKRYFRRTDALRAPRAG